LYLMKHGGARGLYRIRRVAETGVPGAQLPDRTAITLQVRPHPARAGRWIEISAPWAPTGPVALRIIDAGGRALATLPGTSAGRGVSLAWDGRDGAGRLLPAGVYFLTLEQDGEALGAGRVSLVR
jgi:hypothetical protein